MPKNSQSNHLPSHEQGLLIGRNLELVQIQTCLVAGKNILLEGPVGVGKTHLVLAATRVLEMPVYRIDGDHRYSEQKLSGWFDPPTVIKKGFNEESFIAGPLIEAMQSGGILFINELNRLPEGVQNILLPAIDEKIVMVPRLGKVEAKKGFLVIATQNPKEFVGTSHLSEALLDRFEFIFLDYQKEDEEISIVLSRLQKVFTPAASISKSQLLPKAAVKLVRLTRNHPKIKRGASVRAALSVGEIAGLMMNEGTEFSEAFLAAVLLALPTRMEVTIEMTGEIERSGNSLKTIRTATESLLRDLVEQVLQEIESHSEVEKKKS